MKKVLVTGSSGMLGKDIVKVLRREDNLEVFGFDRNLNSLLSENHQIKGDLTDSVMLRKILRDISPNIIVHCAAIVDVDYCQKNPKRAYDLHIEVTKVLASESPTTSQLIYISSDSVFDGYRGNYTETDHTNPLNYYAQTKLMGEAAALRSNPESTIIRTNIYGFHLPLRKSLVEWAITKFDHNETVSGFSDVFFNPLYTTQLSDLILEILKRDIQPGLLNVGSDSFISKYDFLCKIAEKFGYSSELVQKSESSLADLVAPRPKNTTLNLEKLRGLVGRVPSLQEGIRLLAQDFSTANGRKS